MRAVIRYVGEAAVEGGDGRPFSPEETLPGGEVSALEEGVFQDTLHATQGLDHVCAIIVQVPKLSIVPLVCPPEWILF